MNYRKTPQDILRDNGVVIDICDSRSAVEIVQALAAAGKLLDGTVEITTITTITPDLAGQETLL